MVSKTIKSVLSKKVHDWVESIPKENGAVREAIERNTIITGGAIVSLLNNETPNDFDVYFRTLDSLKIVSNYYVDFFNKRIDAIIAGKVKTRGRPKAHRTAELQEVTMMEREYTDIAGIKRTYEAWTPIKKDEERKDIPGEIRLRVFIRSVGAANEYGTVDLDEELTDEQRAAFGIVNSETKVEEEAPKYRPVFLSSNAITLSDKVQIVLRFWGEPDVIHQNYDFVHCKCVWTSWDNKLSLPAEALEAIINKQLHYVGSKYPLCSIIRTRKFIQRGWTINAGQYLKMVLQLGEMDLTKLPVFEEQLTGVDAYYFNAAITYLKKKIDDDASFKVTVPYLIELIDKMF